jgi:hypothetical protein
MPPPTPSQKEGGRRKEPGFSPALANQQVQLKGRQSWARQSGPYVSPHPHWPLGVPHELMAVQAMLRSSSNVQPEQAPGLQAKLLPLITQLEEA